MRKTLVFLMAAVFLSARAQDVFKPLTLGDSVSLKLGGFVRNEIFYDTRKMSEVVDGLFTYAPEQRNLDAAGRDINDVQSLNMMAITTRLNGLFTGPNAFGAKTSAFFEFDFTGYNISNGVRFRQGWIKLKWTKCELLMGQFWHPYFLLENAPTVLGLNTGAPYATFNRSPQLRFTYNITPKFSAFLAAVFQTGSGTIGPSAASLDYMRTGGIPEVIANLQYKESSFAIGVTGGMKTLRPRQTTTGVTGLNGSRVYKTMNLLQTYTGQVYGSYARGPLKVKASAMYGQEGYELNMIGGYAIATRDVANGTGHETYTPTNHLSTWLNITYGKDFMIGLFAGYVKNMGTSENYVSNTLAFPSFFGRGENIAYIYRISPHFSYKVKRFQFGMEFEHNVAAYGTPDANNKGIISKAYENKGMRVLGIMMFYF